MTESSVASYYAQDHNRLDALFKRFQVLKAANPAEAMTCFRAFHTGLLQHIRWEEDILFPLFEAKTGLADMGPTHVMRFEHQQIQTLLEAIQHCAQPQRGSKTEERELVELLGAHNDKEEHILYPAIDAQLTEPERREVFAKMAATPHD